MATVWMKSRHTLHDNERRMVIPYNVFVQADEEFFTKYGPAAFDKCDAPPKGATNIFPVSWKPPLSKEEQVKADREQAAEDKAEAKEQAAADRATAREQAAEDKAAAKAAAAEEPHHKKGKGTK